MSRRSKYKLGHVYKWRSSYSRDTCLFVPFIRPKGSPVEIAIDLYTGEAFTYTGEEEIGTFLADGRAIVGTPAGGNFPNADNDRSGWGVVIDESAFPRGECFHNWGTEKENVEEVGVLLL